MVFLIQNFPLHISFMGLFQAVGFLVSTNNHAVAEETELHENVYSNDHYGDTASLLEQVLVNNPCPFELFEQNLFLLLHL